MRSSVKASSPDLVAHSQEDWPPENMSQAQSITGEILTIKGTQSHAAIVKNSSQVSDGKLYIVSLDIMSIDSGRVRVQLGDAEGEWRKEAGLYTEFIIARGKDIRVVADPNCKATINLSRMSVRRKT